MDLIDFILNIAGLLIWMNWRSGWRDPLIQAAPTTLVGTLRRAEPAFWQRWHLLAGVAALIFARALFYSQVGHAVNWTPKLDLGFVVIAFRGDVFFQALIFSALSFLRVLVVACFWLLALAALNGRTGENDPVQKMVLLQLGPAGRWPWAVQMAVPLFAVALLWMAAHPLLARVGVINWTESPLRVAAQGLLVGCDMYFTLKYLLPVFLLLHLVTSYVYLGSNPAWDFISLTARNILAPLRRLPLRSRKIDFSPAAGIILIFLLLHVLPEALRAHLASKGLSLWPD